MVYATAARALRLPRLRRAGDSELVSGSTLSTSFSRTCTLMRLTTCSPQARFSAVHWRRNDGALLESFAVTGGLPTVRCTLHG